jgi:hypothetical protein
MKKLLFITSWVLMPFLLIQAQSGEYRLTEGPIMKTSLRSMFLGFVFQDENMSIARVYEKGKTIFERYNSDLTLSSKATIKRTKMVDGNKAEFVSTLTLKDKVYLLFQIIDGKTDQAKLIAFEMDKITLQITDDYITLAESNHKKRMKLTTIKASAYTYSPFNVFVSKEMERFCIITDSELSRKENKTFDVNVFDFNMTKKWSKNIEIPYPEGKFETLSFDVDLNNNVYIIGSFQESKMSKDKEYLILRLSEKNEVAEEIKIPQVLDGNNLTRFNFYVNKITNDLQVSGFYFVNEGKNKENGFYYFTIDQKSFTLNQTKFYSAKEILTESTEAMDEEETSKRKERQQNREAKSFSNLYQLRNVIYKPEGGTMLVYEEYRFYTTQNTRTDSQGRTTTTTTNHYHYDDIITINLDKQGEMIWARKIPKIQYTTNDGGAFSSIALMPGRDKLFMIFNDNISNVGKVNNSSVYSSFTKRKNMITAIVGLNKDGDHTRESLVSLAENNLRLMPSFSQQITDKKMILYYRFMGKQRFMVFEVL